ncbi:MAG: hypothetical protein IJP78_12435, partial [Clostridia bacterium]|nr:hypothetical protein [Clostridia bacterium]
MLEVHFSLPFLKLMFILFTYSCIDKLGFVEETLGALRPQTPDQGRDAPGPSLGEAACKDIPNKRRLPRWGLRKFDGFWPKKAGKIP